MLIINKPLDKLEDFQLEDVQCYKCKVVMKAHPMSNINSEYFINCELHRNEELRVIE